MIVPTLIIIVTFILLITYLCYRRNLIKEDILLIEKYFVVILFMLYLFALCLLELLELIKDEENKQYIKYGLFGFLGFYLINIVSVNVEFYCSITNSFYIFNSIFSNKKKNILWEAITIVFIGLFVSINVVFEKEDIIKYIKNGLIALLSIIAIIFQSISLYLVYQIQNTSKINMKIKLISYYISSFLLLCYACINCISDKFLSNNEQFFIPIFIILFIVLVDVIFQMIIIRTSDFYFYNLGSKKSIAKFYNWCFTNRHYKKSIFGKEKKNEITKDDILHNFIENLKYCNLSQINIELCEYSLNVALGSIGLIFDKIRKINNESVTVPSSRSSTTTKPQELSDSLLSVDENNKDIHENYRHFQFKKGHFQEEKINSMIKFDNNLFDKVTEHKLKFSNSVNVDIKYYYYEKFLNIINTQRIDLSEVKASLTSHITKEFPFLISNNSRENYFRSLKTFSLKSNDKHLLIEIFDDILSSKCSKRNISLYLDYISRTNSQTFLPLLLGVFKVQINSFSPFTIFLFKNTIVENMPKDIFNYWQFMRYTYENKIEKISTSKDRTSICITEDNLFNGISKISLNNFSLFEKILKEDFAFLQSINSKNFSLLIMYYEFDQAGMKSLLIDPGEDISKIRISTSNFRISDVKNFNFNEENMSMSELDKDLSIIKGNKDNNGFDAKFNNFKAKIFFGFENIFEFRGISFQKRDLEKFQQNILKNFDFLNVIEE